MARRSASPVETTKDDIWGLWSPITKQWNMLFRSEPLWFKTEKEAKEWMNSVGISDQRWKPKPLTRELRKAIQR